MSNTPYTRLDAVRTYLTLASPESQDDLLLINLMNNAARAVDRYTRRKFYPYTETRFYDYDREDAIRLDNDLLSLTALVTYNGASTIASPAMYLAAGNDWNRSPYDKIHIKSDSGSTLGFSGTPQRANEITGIWGYHEDWNNAWIDTGTSLTRDTGADASLLNIAGAGSYGTGASDVEYNYPRISIGDLLKIGDEYFHVTGSGSTNTLLGVRAGANGTTSGSHASGASIARFLPEAEIEYAVRRLTAWKYAMMNTPFQVKTAIPALGEVSIPSSWPPDIIEIVERYKKPTIRNI